MRIVITGAAGHIGRKILEELFQSHDLCLIDRYPVPGYESIITDLSQYEGKTKFNSSQEIVPKLWTDAFDKAEIVIHLAEEPKAHASWERVFQNNIMVTWNVFQACAQHRVCRVIYASSNWVVKALELELAPACYDPEGPKIGSDANPRPVNPYGIGKAFGEMIGRILVDEERISSFVALRIGWFTPNPPDNADYRRRAIGEFDLRNLFRRCVEAEFEGFHIIYGVSAQKISPYDISYTTRLLSWEPKQIFPCAY
jgi:NAD+ dependent glucose-6-phosphate dehydrogenase